MYKWKPSAAARRAFAEKMQNPIERQAYEQRKAEKASKRRAGSSFDYETAGGMYVPSVVQYDFCMSRPVDMTPEQESACNMVIMGYNCNEKVHHDHIHIVNEMIRRQSV
jgi:hypothetical protein